jgi:diazepam-binding inhibitor (GABA receptor modulating acyl-CoA-binding protein)
MSERDEVDTVKASFDAAVESVKTGPAKSDTSDADKLKVYGLFKQATEGDVTGSQPWAINVVARAKYDAWATHKGMSKEDAMKAYVDEVKSQQE